MSMIKQNKLALKKTFDCNDIYGFTGNIIKTHHTFGKRVGKRS